MTRISETLVGNREGTQQVFVSVDLMNETGDRVCNEGIPVGKPSRVTKGDGCVAAVVLEDLSPRVGVDVELQHIRVAAIGASGTFVVEDQQVAIGQEVVAVLAVPRDSVSLVGTAEEVDELALGIAEETDGARVPERE